MAGGRVCRDTCASGRFQAGRRGLPPGGATDHQKTHKQTTTFHIHQSPPEMATPGPWSPGLTLLTPHPSPRSPLPRST